MKPASSSIAPQAVVPEFAFVTCAHGAEAAVKMELASQQWRLAFSRPGFVTLKRETSDTQLHGRLPHGIFVRTASHSIGQVRCVTDSGRGSAAEMIESLESQLAASTHATRPFDQIHVWTKDRAPIGRFDFEPGIDEISRAVADEILSRLGERFVRTGLANQVAQPGERILDVVLVEPTHWFFGHHTATTWPTRWPGGVQPMELAEPPISRAYYKAAESIVWSGFELRPGDLAIEIGSAPGGACQRLLELGLNVIGIDPAEMDEDVATHPRFTHRRARAGDLPRREYRGAKWLLVDSNVKPEQTLQTVANIVNNRNCDLVGILLTLKIGDYESASKIDRWRETIERWGVADIRIRQLARNRCEVCFAITVHENQPK